ncbi:MAG: L,D-transpeptidase [Tannerellaceae bacterium]|nr:L,D-transpeptidase [Tannerellaceae bacterium]
MKRLIKLLAIIYLFLLSAASSAKPEPSIIRIEKDFLYDQYTLADTYPYKETIREFQWDKIRQHLARVMEANQQSGRWGVVQNRKNVNGEPPVADNSSKNDYNRLADSYGVERYQGIPFYGKDTVTPERYGRDGFPVRIIQQAGNYYVIETINFDGQWRVPTQYVELFEASPGIPFKKVAVVDRANQNITTLEQSDTDLWLVRSMNPATTGAHHPPYERETPLGYFVIQEKKPKMVYPVDGSTETGGFASYASRFCNGGYIHGVPVNAPRTSLIEFSNTLGTTPRSHMCVRNATSHAKFVYDWAPIHESLVIVLE